MTMWPTFLGCAVYFRETVVVVLFFEWGGKPGPPSFSAGLPSLGPQPRNGGGQKHASLQKVVPPFLPGRGPASSLLGWATETIGRKAKPSASLAPQDICKRWAVLTHSPGLWQITPISVAACVPQVTTLSHSCGGWFHP